jgi:hypothetical protein
VAARFGYKAGVKGTSRWLRARRKKRNQTQRDEQNCTQFGWGCLPEYFHPHVIIVKKKVGNDERLEVVN